MSIVFEPIGIIFTPFHTNENMPIQTTGAKGIKGRIEVKKEFAAGLIDLNGFSHIILIYYFHKSIGFELQITPFLDNKKHGVFSTRAPKRPNPIGISVVKLIAVNNNILDIENVDIIDGTPLLDIKPYISEFDIHKVEEYGWIKGKTSDVNETKSDDRFK